MSLLKFLKINGDASVSNKYLSVIESGEPVVTKCDSSDDEVLRVLSSVGSSSPYLSMHCVYRTEQNSITIPPLCVICG